MFILLSFHLRKGPLLGIANSLEALDEIRVGRRDRSTTGMGGETRGLLEALLQKVVLRHRLEHFDRLLLDPHVELHILYNLSNHALECSLGTHRLLRLLLQAANLTQCFLIDGGESPLPANLDVVAAMGRHHPAGFEGHLFRACH